MIVSNPRFPHRCRIIRKTSDTPLIDEEGYSPLDSDEEYVVDDMLLRKTFLSGLGDLLKIGDALIIGEKEVATIIYDGPCRSYEKHTTSDRGEVITSYRGLALPLTQDDWTRLGIIPLEGDELAVDRGAYVEYGRVVDKNPANFHGTHLTWRYGRN